MTVLNGMFIGWIELATLVVAGLVIPPERIGTGQAFFASTRAVAGTLASKFIFIHPVTPKSFPSRAELTFLSKRISGNL